MGKILASEHRVLGAVAKWAIQQSPYYRPDNLEVVLDALHDNIKNTFASAPLGFAEFPSEKVLREFIHANLAIIAPYNAWNERKNGREGMGVVSAGHHDDGSVTINQPSPDDDFIDLDALEMNVVAEIINYD